MLSPGPVFPFEESAFSHSGGQGSASAARGAPCAHWAHHKSPIKPVLQTSPVSPTSDADDQRDCDASPGFYSCLTLPAGCASSVLSAGQEGNTGTSWEAENPFSPE